MEIFYSSDIRDGRCFLDSEESGHCIRVLRHREGDRISVIDGEGTMYDCILETADQKKAELSIVSANPGWGGHPYDLTLAVCPTKNNERFEWFVEKAVEIGVDTIAPVIGERSERKVYKTDRACRIALSAAKQSLKSAVPQIPEPVSVKDFIRNADPSSLRLIAYCFEDESHPRISIRSALERYDASRVVVLIGPEGDFSCQEAALALGHGFIPVHLGESRLRTETAAVTAAEAVYFKNMS